MTNDPDLLPGEPARPDAARVRAVPLPPAALLRRHAEAGAYTDCYVVEIACQVSLSAYIDAFYATPLFRAERFVLSLALSRPSTDAELRALAQGGRDRFAAWTVEAREPDQILMCDMHGRTRSWLMVRGSVDVGATQLYFGSAVIPQRDPRDDASRMGALFRVLLPLHRIYSRALLHAARHRLQRAAQAAA